MTTKLRSFTTGILIVLFVLIAFIFAAYRFGWSGTGFLNKTLWDWLQLLIIPLALAVVALLFNLASARNEQKIALDKQRQDLLESYLDRMAELLLEKQLGTSASKGVRNVPPSRYKYGRERPRGTSASKGVRNVARVRTISVLTQLDGRRVSYVFAFLHQAGLMSTASRSKMREDDTDIRPATPAGGNIDDWDITSYGNVNDNLVSLRDADFHGVNWSQADLCKTDLRNIDLSDANLSHTSLYGTDLYFADLYRANLSGADLSNSNLRRANLSGADLRGANLNGADLSYADLSGAQLRGANLRDAKVTKEQLKKAKSQGTYWRVGRILPGTGYARSRRHGKRLQ